MLVGRGNAGKASTVRGLPFNDSEETTPGIVLCDWVMNFGEAEPVTAHVWDFAGLSPKGRSSSLGRALFLHSGFY